MKKKLTIVGIVLAVLCIISAGVLFVPNPAGKYLIGEAKASGIIPYEPVEAYTLAKRICTQCHTDERIKKYCERCGPPFVAVVPHMQSFIDNYRTAKPELKVENITEVQAVAIVQVWNAIIGNWEKDFREQDMLKLIGSYKLLAKLYLTPIEKRPIEMALMGRKDLKVGYMADMAKTLSKGAEGAAEDTGAIGTMDHSSHDHSKMEMDHSKMNMDGAAKQPAADSANDHSQHSEHTHKP